MFLTTHAAAGILIADKVHNPVAVFGLAFASHFVLDFIPHGDETLYHDEEWKSGRRYRRAVLINLLDVAGLVAMVLWSLNQPDLPSSRLLLIGILGSVLPDFLSHLFPVLHERLSWLFLVRWLYSLTKPTGVRYLVRAQNWLHTVLHHDIVQRDIPFTLGLGFQLILVIGFLSFLR